MNFDWLQSKDNALIYIGDTMCSWCHGFANELTTIKDNHPELDFKMIQGGLRPFNTEKAIDMADFLRSHWVEINERTGQPFSYDILEDPDFIYDTEPASRAVVVARMMNPEIEFEFFKAVQTSFYRDNVNTNEIETYLKLAADFGLDKTLYQEQFESDLAKENTKADFALSQQLGIKGFPSMVLKKDNRFMLISNGYNTADAIEETLKMALSS